jgi:hypothetical protein
MKVAFAKILCTSFRWRSFWAARIRNKRCSSPPIYFYTQKINAQAEGEKHNSINLHLLVEVLVAFPELLSCLCIAVPFQIQIN